MRTDAAPISNRLPKLGEPKSVLWQSVLLNKDTFFSPPVLDPIYRIQGLAVLEKSKAEEFSRIYQWQKMPANWMPDLAVKSLELTLPDWNCSTAFTMACKPQQYTGELYFDRSNGIVYFDIEISK